MRATQVLGVTAIAVVAFGQAAPALARTPSPTPTTSPNPSPHPSAGVARGRDAASPQATVTETETITPTPTPTPTVTPTPTPTPTTTGSASFEVDECFPGNIQQVRAQDAEPDFGCGKITVEVEPVASTYPAGQLPDLAGLSFDILDTTENDGTPATGSCTTAKNTSDSGASCPENDGPTSGDGSEFGPFSTWTPGHGYRVSLDSSTSVPAHTLIPDVTGTFADCTSYSGVTSPSGCPDTVVLHAYGLYRHIGLVVHNSVTHKVVADAKYALCSPTTAAPATGGSGCPTGATALATATTNGSGFLEFAGLYAGSDNYSVVPVTVPHGYNKPGSQRLEVPAVTTEAQAGTLLTGKALLAPKPPVLTNVFGTTTENTAVTVNLFANATPVSAPLTLTGLGTPSNGTATDPHASATYTPHHNFVGTDSFTYSARNRLGGTATATVTIKIVVTGGSGATAPSLPYTGAPIAVEVGWSTWTIAAGSFFVVLARRRRRLQR